MSAVVIIHRRGPEPVLVRHRERRTSARQRKIYDADFRVTADRAALALPVSFFACHSSPQQKNRHRPDTASSVTRERNDQCEPCGALYESFVNGGRITAKVFSQRLPNLSEQPALARPSIDSRDATARRTALRRNSRGSGNGKCATRHVPVSISGIGGASRRSMSQTCSRRMQQFKGVKSTPQSTAKFVPLKFRL